MLNSIVTNTTHKELIVETPYTMEEIDYRLQQSEEDFRMGRISTNAEVLSELRTFIDSL